MSEKSHPYFVLPIDCGVKLCLRSCEPYHLSLADLNLFGLDKALEEKTPEPKVPDYIPAEIKEKIEAQKREKAEEEKDSEEYQKRLKNAVERFCRLAVVLVVGIESDDGDFVACRLSWNPKTKNEFPVKKLSDNDLLQIWSYVQSHKSEELEVKGEAEALLSFFTLARCVGSFLPGTVTRKESRRLTEYFQQMAG